jgi:hypothetical protein
MKKLLCMAMLIGLSLTPWALAQAPTDQTAIEPAKAPLIPDSQQPTKEKMAQLFEAMRVREQVQSMLKLMPALMQQQIKEQAKQLAAKGGKTLTPEEQAAFDKAERKYLDKAMNIITIDEMLDDMATVYQHHFTRYDIDDFITFYHSPAGQHLLEQQPAIMQEYMPMVMKRAQERTKDLTDELAKDMEEMTKTKTGGVYGIAPPPPPQAPAAK